MPQVFAVHVCAAGFAFMGRITPSARLLSVRKQHQRRCRVHVSRAKRAAATAPPRHLVHIIGLALRPCFLVRTSSVSPTKFRRPIAISKSLAIVGAKDASRDLCSGGRTGQAFQSRSRTAPDCRRAWKQLTPNSRGTLAADPFKNVSGRLRKPEPPPERPRNTSDARGMSLPDPRRPLRTPLRQPLRE